MLRGMRITSGLPSLLRVSPLLGRGFTLADEEVGAPAVVMLSYEVWHRDYGGVNDVLGLIVRPKVTMQQGLVCTLSDLVQPRQVIVGTGSRTLPSVLPRSNAPHLDHRFWLSLVRRSPA